MTPNGRYVLNDLEFEQKINQMSDRELLEFTARQTYDVCILAADNKRRITTLETQNHRRAGFVGGFGALIGVAIASVADYFMRR